MNKEFIPYEQALELKELGFDEPCFSLYLDNDKKTMTSSMKGADTNSWLKAHYTGYGDSITAPLYQQAFRWFREKGYRFGIRWDVEYDKYWFDVWSSYKKDDETFYQFQFESEIIYNTYEEAEQSCLTKLIEIYKNK